MNTMYSIMRFISFGFQLSRFRYFHTRNKQLAAQAKMQRAEARHYRKLTRKPVAMARQQVFNQYNAAVENKLAEKRLAALYRGVRP